MLSSVAWPAGVSADATGGGKAARRKTLSRALGQHRLDPQQPPLDPLDADSELGTDPFPLHAFEVQSVGPGEIFAEALAYQRKMPIHIRIRT
jgi:hypothetical protein